MSLSFLEEWGVSVHADCRFPKRFFHVSADQVVQSMIRGFDKLGLPHTCGDQPCSTRQAQPAQESA